MAEGAEGRMPSGLDAAYAAAFDGLPVPLLVYDPETRGILAVNDAACEQYGYTRAELLGSSIERLLDPSEVPALREVSHRGGPRARVWKDRRKDGTTIWVEAASTDIPFEGGTARLVVAVDVTERERALEELRASESRLRALVGSIDEVLFEFDREGTCLGIWTVNEALLVAPREQMLGRRIVELVGPERGRPLEEAVARVIDGGRAETVEYDVDLPDGTHWGLARIAPIPGPGGRPRTASFLARDITSRVRAEQELRRAEERWRTLIEQLPAVVIVERPSPDPRKLLVEYLSPQAEEVYGSPVEEIVGDPSFFERILHPEDRERVLAADARSEQTGEPFDEVYRVIREDGRVIWIHSTSRLIRDAEGNPRSGSASSWTSPRRRRPRRRSGRSRSSTGPSSRTPGTWWRSSRRTSGSSTRLPPTGRCSVGTRRSSSGGARSSSWTSGTSSGGGKRSDAPSTRVRPRNPRGSARGTATGGRSSSRAPAGGRCGMGRDASRRSSLSRATSRSWCARRKRGVSCSRVW